MSVNVNCNKIKEMPNLVKEVSEHVFHSGESYQCSHCLKYCASERILRDHMAHHGKLFISTMP